MVIYNLIHEPWIPCLDAESRPRHVGLVNLFRQADTLLEISDPSPLVTIALHRPLLAILYRTQKVSGNEAWSRLWREGWDQKAIDEYLERWEPSFDLFSKTAPFYQRIDLEGDHDNATPISKLSPEMTAGNNKQLFDHSSDTSPRPVSAADAARLLVSIQSWGLGGGKSGGGRPNYQHAPLVGGAAVILKGKTLRETLLLNLVPKKRLGGTPRNFVTDDTQDVCAWEKSDTPPVPSRLPLGISDYLTWQSRYIRLLPNDDAAVSRCIYCQGEGIATEGRLLDPFHAIYETKKGQLASVSVKRDQATWRDSASLFNTFDESGSLGVAAVSAYAGIVQNRMIDPRKRIPALVAGMANDKAAVLRWTSDLITVPERLLIDAEAIAALEHEIDAAKDIAKVISRGLYFYTAYFLFGDRVREDGIGTLGRNENDDCRKLAQKLSVSEQFWSEAELAFSEYMASDDFPDGAKWRLSIRRSAIDVFEASIASAEINPRVLRAQVPARGVFYGELNKLIPKPNEGGESNAA